MQIVVAVKAVPDGETRLRPAPDGLRLDPEGVKWVLAGYDESAVEQALLLKEATPGSTVRVVSFGPSPRTEEVLRAALALGCDQAVHVEQPSEVEADPVLAARAIATVLAISAPDLILCGKQAGDDEAGLFGPALAAALVWPSYGAVVDLRWDGGAQQFRFQRVLDRGTETVAAPSPCLVALQQAWNDPRTAKLPSILKSRKAPIEKVPWSQTQAALGASATPGTAVVGFRLPPPRSGARMLEYKTPEEAASQLVRILREEAKVFP